MCMFVCSNMFMHIRFLVNELKVNISTHSQLCFKKKSLENGKSLISKLIVFKVIHVTFADFVYKNKIKMSSNL